MAKPIAPKPSSIIAQVLGSGTAAATPPVTDARDWPTMRSPLSRPCAKREVVEADANGVGGDAQAVDPVTAEDLFVEDDRQAGKVEKDRVGIRIGEQRRIDVQGRHQRSADDKSFDRRRSARAQTTERRRRRLRLNGGRPDAEKTRKSGVADQRRSDANREVVDCRGTGRAGRCSGRIRREQSCLNALGHAKDTAGQCRRLIDRGNRIGCVVAWRGSAARRRDRRDVDRRGDDVANANCLICAESITRARRCLRQGGRRCQAKAKCGDEHKSFSHICLLRLDAVGAEREPLPHQA